MSEASETADLPDNIWYKGMRSPNPKGRPKGIPDKRTAVQRKMLENADGIVDSLIEKALEGDSGAAQLILQRVIPAMRSQSEKVQFDFDATAPVVQQIEQVLSATASGVVAADVAKQIIDAIGVLDATRANADFEERIRALEAKQ